MKSRCENPNFTGYANYGGRGVKVCEEWKSFEAFREWALANGYAKNLQIDRLNNDSGYSPDNCRWVTQHQNLMNKRKRSNSASPFKGVRRKRGKWRATVILDGIDYNLGVFVTQEEAARAYDAKAKELFGEFAYLNFPS